MHKKNRHLKVQPVPQCQHQAELLKLKLFSEANFPFLAYVGISCLATEVTSGGCLQQRFTGLCLLLPTQTREGAEPGFSSSCRQYYLPTAMWQPCFVAFQVLSTARKDFHLSLNKTTITKEVICESLLLKISTLQNSHGVRAAKASVCLSQKQANSVTQISAFKERYSPDQCGTRESQMFSLLLSSKSGWI